ncbi:Tetratricopeptide repeat protein [Stieleria maiorica]|uniref:Tetratricopeptide repeat protein n=1 Tax=Stieleria maiorica TaxID=2795974 RepID=A0A5B9MQ79_9BACT|nr:tetratricopeptide repeat protein [Stieleria maiorica]QEG01935.1 Tetratricopeptide repeat protein [Stieleria maiorica]
MKPVLLLIVLSTISSGLSVTCSVAAELQDGEVSAAELATDNVTAARDLFVQSLKATGRDRLAGLKKSFEQLEVAAAESDQLPPALTMWGRLLLAAGDQRSGLRALQQATTAHSDGPDAYVSLGNLAVRRGQLAEARLCYNEADRLIAIWSETHPRRTSLLAQVAAGRASVAQARIALLASTEQREMTDHYHAVALANLREWVSLAADDPVAHQRLAEAMIAAGDVDQAIAAFDNARKLDASLPLTEFRLAKALLRQGDRSQALMQVHQAVAQHSDSANVRLTAADLLLSLGEIESAEEQISAVQTQDADNTAAKLLQAQSERFRGDWQAAADILQTLHTHHPANVEVANMLALTLSEVDSPEAQKRALALATVNAERFDQLESVAGRRARITLVWTTFAAGQPQAAKRSFAELLKAGIASNQVSGDEAYYASRLLVEFGRPELAAPLLGSVLARVDAFPKRAACDDLLKQLQ